MATQAQIKWQAFGQDRAYAIFEYQQDLVNDVIIDLRTIYSSVTGLDNLKPVAMELNFSGLINTSVYKTLMTIDLDGVILPIYGRYRRALDNSANLLTIKAGSYSAVLKFYSWEVFGEGFQDNTYSVNGLVSVVDNGKVVTLGQNAFVMPVQVSVAANQAPAIELNPSILALGGIYITKIELFSTGNVQAFIGFNFTNNTNIPTQQGNQPANNLYANKRQSYSTFKYGVRNTANEANLISVVTNAYILGNAAPNVIKFDDPIFIEFNAATLFTILHRTLFGAASTFTANIYFEEYLIP